MSDYKKLLNALTLTNIKALVRTYISHVKFTVAKKTKDELIEHVMKHTELVDGKVKTKPISFDMVKNKEKVKKEKVVKEKKEKAKKDDEKPKKVVKEKKEKAKKDDDDFYNQKTQSVFKRDVVEKYKSPEESKKEQEEFDKKFVIKRREVPKTTIEDVRNMVSKTDQEIKEIQKQLKLKKRNDPLSVIFPDSIINNADKLKGFKTADRKNQWIVDEILHTIKDGDDFMYSSSKDNSDNIKKIVDEMLMSLGAKHVAKAVVGKVMNDGRQAEMNNKQKEMYNDYLNNFSIGDLKGKINHINKWNSPEVVKQFYQDEIDIINKLIPIKEKLQKSENEKLKKSGESDYSKDGEALGRLEDKLSKLSDKQLNNMLDDLNRLIRNSPFEMYPNERVIINMIKQELHNRS